MIRQHITQPVIQRIYPDPAFDPVELGEADDDWVDPDALTRVQTEQRTHVRTTTDTKPKRCQCTFTWRAHVPRTSAKHGHVLPWSAYQQRVAGALELIVKTPLKISVNFDGGEVSSSPQPQVAIEAKFGYRWLLDSPSNWQTWQWATYLRVFKQQQTQEAIATLCGVKHQVRVSSQTALDGLPSRCL